MQTESPDKNVSFSRQRHVVLVEDDPAISTGLRALLESEQYRVDSFSSGEDALAGGIRNADLVLLDIGLPGMNGYSVCRALRESGFVNPVVMLSARSEQMDKVIGLEVGADDYITKPFHPRELLTRLEANLRQSERGRKSIDTADAPDERRRRKLMAIMFTDICEYSKIMHRDEELCMKLLSAHNDLLDSVIPCHNGRTREKIGDAYLVTFENTLDAVRCASDIQTTLQSRNRTSSSEERIRVRIGIHIGDVLEQGNDIKGDAVNLAARLQQISDPGTICVSENVKNSIINKIDLSMEDLGDIELKHISQPMHVFRISGE